MLSGTEANAFLIELHDLEDRLAGLKSKNSGPVPLRIQTVRDALPEQVLSHHDRMRVKGKRSVAAIRHWVCSGCFMGIPIGERSQVQTGKDLCLCQTCGRFLYLEADSEPNAEPQMFGKGRAAAASDALPRKRKAIKVARLTP